MGARGKRQGDSRAGERGSPRNRSWRCMGGATYQRHPHPASGWPGESELPGQRPFSTLFPQVVDSGCPVGVDDLWMMWNPWVGCPWWVRRHRSPTRVADLSVVNEAVVPLVWTRSPEWCWCALRADERGTIDVHLVSSQVSGEVSGGLRFPRNACV